MNGYAANEEQLVRGLTAVVHCAGHYTAASRLCAEQGFEVSAQALRDWCLNRHAARYAELRDRYAAELEEKLIHDMRDLAAQGVEAQRVAISEAHKLLESGDDKDPSRTAANLSRVVQTNVDKMLAVSGRPTSIREDRSLDEILRALTAKGIIELPPEDVTEEEPPELEEGSNES